uniref:Uncharacterized protein n=1 Tax=Anguilla anguilla TaxID=7936 RepID=A0A0E9X3L8_ANGAN
MATNPLKKEVCHNLQSVDASLLGGMFSALLRGTTCIHTFGILTFISLLIKKKSRSLMSQVFVCLFFLIV